jgi:hypothetical protein
MTAIAILRRAHAAAARSASRCAGGADRDRDRAAVGSALLSSGAYKYAPAMRGSISRRR